MNKDGKKLALVQGIHKEEADGRLLYSKGPCTPSVCVCDAFSFHYFQWYYTDLAMADISKHQKKSMQLLGVQGPLDPLNSSEK